MRTEHYRARDLTTLLRKQKIATMTELKDVLGSAADITIFRKLAELSYQTSYSHRGRYYTLADIPQYDAWGLWSYRSVWFSRRGTLLACYLPAGRARVPPIPRPAGTERGVRPPRARVTATGLAAVSPI